jgi:hypothetical protein
LTASEERNGGCERLGTRLVRCFDERIPLPDGRLLRTLLDPGQYVAELPEAQHERPEWQRATALLLSAAEGRAPIMFANAALFRAIYGAILRG